MTYGRIFVPRKGCARDYVAFSIGFLQIYSLELAVTRPFFHLSVHIRDSTPPLLIGILTIYKVSKDCRLGVHFVGLNLPKGPEIAFSVNFRASAISPIRLEFKGSPLTISLPNFRISCRKAA